MAAPTPVTYFSGFGTSPCGTETTAFSLAPGQSLTLNLQVSIAYDPTNGTRLGPQSSMRFSGTEAAPIQRTQVTRAINPTARSTPFCRRTAAPLRPLVRSP